MTNIAEYKADKLSKYRHLNPDTIERIAEILKTISHPVRLEVLEFLEGDKSFSVAELMEKTGVEQSLLSHHLTKMKDKGILKSKRDGKKILYSLTDNNITKIFTCLDSCSFVQ